MRKINFVNLPARHEDFKADFHRVLDQTLESGSYILGDMLADFEHAVADYIGVRHVIGVANGTDALTLSLQALGIGEGDEVITSPMSYLATTSSIALSGACAVFADIDDSLNLDPKAIEEAITDKTKAIMLVHLSGLPARMDEILDVVKRHDLYLIEDVAQSFGARYHNQEVGTFGNLAGVSFHPLKNLGGVGDGGAIFTNDPTWAHWLRQARNHGHSDRNKCDFWSVNSRLDALQAGFLKLQLEAYPRVLQHRLDIAKIYHQELADLVRFPVIWEDCLASYNWFMILTENRESLMGYLLEQGIETKVHYPLLIPDLKAAQKKCRYGTNIPTARHYVDRILSLPNSEHISHEDVYYICDKIKAFYGKLFVRTVR